MPEAVCDRTARSCWGHSGPGQEDAEVEMLGNRLGAAAALAGGAALVYFGFLRDWHLPHHQAAGRTARPDTGTKPVTAGCTPAPIVT
jgi:hypothetical protein